MILFTQCYIFLSDCNASSLMKLEDTFWFDHLKSAEFIMNEKNINKIIISSSLSIVSVSVSLALQK